MVLENISKGATRTINKDENGLREFRRAFDFKFLFVLRVGVGHELLGE